MSLGFGTVNQLPLMFQCQQYNEGWGVGIQHDVLIDNVLAKVGEPRLLR